MATGNRDIVAGGPHTRPRHGATVYCPHQGDIGETGISAYITHCCKPRLQGEIGKMHTPDGPVGRGFEHWHGDPVRAGKKIQGEMCMHIHQTRQQGFITEINDCCTGGQLRRVDSGNQAVFYHHPDRANDFPRAYIKHTISLYNGGLSLCAGTETRPLNGHKKQ